MVAFCGKNIGLKAIGTTWAQLGRLPQGTECVGGVLLWPYVPQAIKRLKQASRGNLCRYAYTWGFPRVNPPGMAADKCNIPLHLSCHLAKQMSTKVKNGILQYYKLSYDVRSLDHIR